MILLLFIIGSIGCVCIDEPTSDDQYTYSGNQVYLNMMCVPNTDSFQKTISGIKQKTGVMYSHTANGYQIVYLPEIIAYSTTNNGKGAAKPIKFLTSDLYSRRGETYAETTNGLYLDEAVDCISTSDQTCLIQVDESYNILPVFNRPTSSGFHSITYIGKNAICIQLENSFYVPLNKFPRTFNVDVDVHICKKTKKYECECENPICQTKLSRIDSENCASDVDKYSKFQTDKIDFFIAFHGMLYNFTKDSVKSYPVEATKVYKYEDRDIVRDNRPPVNISYNLYMKKNLSVDSSNIKPTATTKSTTTTKKSTTTTRKSTTTTKAITANITISFNSTITNSTQVEIYRWSNLEYCILVINGICDIVNGLAVIYIVYSIFNNYIKLETTRSEYNLIKK